MTSIDTTALPPLPEAPTPERLREVFELITDGAYELSELRETLEQLEERGYGERECLRHLELERLAKERDLTADEQAEAEALEAIRVRAERISGPLSYELAGLIAIVCRELIATVPLIVKDAEEILQDLAELTGFLMLPPGGSVRDELRKRAEIYERRAAKERQKAAEFERAREREAGS